MTLVVVLVQAPVPAPVIAEPLPRERFPTLRESDTRERALREPHLRKPPPKAAPEQRAFVALPEPMPAAPAAFAPPAIAEPAPVGTPEPKAIAPATPVAPARDAGEAVPPSFSAAYLRNAPPPYPLIARRKGVEGTVRLKVFVTRDGRPAQVQLDQSSGSPLLDEAALDAVRNWRFVPARRGQDAIESWVLVPIVFELKGASG